ncbi:MAG: SDR family oxidoreductase [Gammaproteobacteria bacterium]|nr:SDR family oxidoreductase [Gammaproteobacteria bacterium]NIM71868.1 SDR family oxidoreductase [Gammaproteobacteria bacterium]NIN37990.1 SDR family oxidoreductase [Gammaproteobacteria bacterium]NIO23624.1 SDR family oxidoreductase [Gammaproteobacteria bacterium]NIO64240.1 SDR family oxidoreductase [Gammaproteobacteria bacterium]
MDISEKVIIITGAARGLGQTYARRFAELGAHLVICDTRSCEETASICRDLDAEIVAIDTDVTDADSTKAMADHAVEQFGGIDVLVNNAALFGSLGFAPFDKLDEQEWDATMNVNVKGIWNCCRAVVPHMRHTGGGSIVNISSLAAIYGMPNGLHYTTSKAAVIGLTRGLAREVGRFNIRVNAVAPNVVDTEAAGEFFGDKKEKLMEATTAQMALRKPVEPDDLFGTILYLASDQSSRTTGQTIMVDGGTVFL